MMKYDNIQEIEEKICKVVYDTHWLKEKGPRNIPQNILQKHNKTGYTRNNPALENLYRAKITRLIIDYVKNAILYAFYNDLTDFERQVDTGYGSYTNLKQQKLIELSENLGSFRYSYHSWEYEETHTTPLIFINRDRNTINLSYISENIGMRFNYDFERKLPNIMKPVYDELKDNDELMCWLFLSGMSCIFDEVRR